MMILALLITVITGCSKSAKEKTHSMEEPQQDRLTIVNGEANIRNNPYDSSGIRHNIILEALRDYQKKTGDTTKAGRKDFLFRELRARDGRVPDIDLGKVETLCQQVQQVGLEKFLSGTSVNKQLQQYLLRLEAITGAVKSPDLFAAFLTGIAELEQEVSKAGALSPSDRESFLRVISITWHSGRYWKNVYDHNTWINPTAEPAEVRWWQWPFVLNADFLGGLVGAVLGGDRHMIEASADWMSGGAEGVLGS